MIPTAKDYLKEKGLSEVISEFDLIEFAKFHVQAALEKAADFDPDSSLSEKTEYILSAYPVKNIK